jgi:hypothetical protein
MWAIAQISTGIIVACCPHLRPLFERILPRRVTHLTTRTSNHSAFRAYRDSQRPQTMILPSRDQSRAGSITVTTTIAIELNGYLPPVPAPAVSIHNEQVDAEAPTFNVEQGPANRLGFLTYRCGGSARCGGCLC